MYSENIFDIQDGQCNFFPLMKPDLEQIFQTGILQHLDYHEDFNISQSHHQKPRGKRVDQNYVRSITRKLLKLLEQEKLIKPKSIKKNQKNQGDLRFILILIRLIQENQRKNILRKIKELINNVYKKQPNNEGKRKQLQLILAIFYQIDLSDTMNIEINMMIMRNAGKKRTKKQFQLKDQTKTFLKYEKKILQGMK